MSTSFSASSSISSMGGDAVRSYNLTRYDESAERDIRPLRNAKDSLLGHMQCVENEELRQSLKNELKRLVGDHDRLVVMLQQRSEMLEQEVEALKLLANDYQRRYDKAVREMQFFKTKYEDVSGLSGKRSDNVSENKQYSSRNNKPRPRSLSINSTSSSEYPSLQPNQTGSSQAISTAHTLQCYPLTPTSPQPSTPSVESIDSPPKASSSSRASTLSGSPTCTSVGTSGQDGSFTPSRNRQGSIAATSVHSTYSASTEGQTTKSESTKSTSSSGRKQSWQLLQQSPSTGAPLASPASTISAPSSNSVHSSPMTPVRSSTATNGYTGASLIQQRRVDPLIFGGSDGIWETISKSEGNDATVEKIISNFLRRGGSPNTAKQSPSGNTVKFGYGMIHALIVTKAPGSLDLLLQQGANPNAMTLSQIDEDKVTPIYIAARVGWLSGLQKLVQAGGDLIAARGGGVKNKTTLHVAAEFCHAAVVEYIVGATQGALNLETDNQGATVLHYACASGHTDLVSFLVRACQIPVDQGDSRGELPLHWAARHGRLEVVTLLIERYGCDCNVYVPRRVGTPLDLAKLGGHRRLVDYLKGIGALSNKKMDKKREEEAEKEVPDHLASRLARNGFFND